MNSLVWIPHVCWSYWGVACHSSQYSGVLAVYRVLYLSPVLCHHWLICLWNTGYWLHIHTADCLRLYCIQLLWTFSIILFPLIVSCRVICDVFERMQQFSPEFAATDCSGIPMFQRWSRLSRPQRWDAVLLSRCVLTVSLTHVHPDRPKNYSLSLTWPLGHLHKIWMLQDRP
jgi:hypothetical protein